jgi:hypothetical protein
MLEDRRIKFVHGRYFSSCAEYRSLSGQCVCSIG